MMRPCIYVQHPEFGWPTFLAVAADVDYAVQLARALSQVLGARAWVADWVRIAHVPQTACGKQLQADRERIYGVAS